MTSELLTQANTLAHELQDLEAQIEIVENMHHCDNLTIECADVGTITIAYDDQLKDDILDLILNSLNTKKGELEDEFRRL